MKRDSWRRGARCVPVLVVVAALVQLTGRASATPERPASPAAATQAVTITLVTGDVVTYDVTGGHRSVGLRSGAGSGSSSIQVVGDAQHLYAIPSAVAAEFWNGSLDRELFDVRYLAENGYGDSKSSTLPVIVQYARSTPPAAVTGDAAALPASDVTVPLPSIRAAALRVRKHDAKTFWHSISAAASTLTPGLQKVWLDRKVKAADDVSGPQIGAPIAWAAGFDGTGIKVAVLDTGIDLTHPDLQGKVADSKVFTGEPSVQDGFGHGTHVASIIAGSGAASGGRYKGVAPGAQLLIGKVLDDSGSGADSQVIAGMQWAAADGARIVNMSLGSGPSDGTDPVSEAVNDLTASTGTLFVIAAGNSGPDPETVEAPGTADAALTVAAVDSADQIASFSSRGPRLGNHVLKPDISAPGVGIVAARAANTNIGTPVGDAYTKLSGTSMATPHVAASAAILAEEHPAWTANQLKAALMSSAKDLADNPYEQGAGRVDIGSAVGEQVFASTTSVDYGELPFPQDGPPLAKTITYTNGSGSPVTLTLDATLHAPDGSPSPAGMLAVQPATLTVPAGGTADATVTLDASLGVAGSYFGSVHATASGVRLTTPVVAGKSPQLFAVTLHGIGRDGQPAALGVVQLLSVDNPDTNKTFSAGSTAQVLVPAGVYSVAANAISNTQPAAEQGSFFLVNPQFDVTQDTDVSLDERNAVEERVDGPQFGLLHNTITVVGRTPVGGGEAVLGTAVGQAYMPVHFYVTPTSAVTVGKFWFNFYEEYGPSPVTMQTVAPSRLSLHPLYTDGYLTAPAFQGKLTAPLIDVGRGTPAELDPLDLHGKLALIVRDSDAECITADVLQDLAQRGAVGVIAYNTHFGHMGGQCTTSTLPAVGVTQQDGLNLLGLLGRGPVKVAVDGTGDNPSYVYHLDFPQSGRIPSNLTHHVDATDLVAVDTRVHAAQPGFYGELSFTYPPDEATSARSYFVVRVPRSVRQFFGPVASDRVWQRISVNDAVPSLADTRVNVFARAGARTEEVDDGPFVPGALTDLTAWAIQPRFSTLCAACREGDGFTPLFPTTTGETADVLSVQQFADMHLYRDGQELTNVGDPVFGLLASFDLPTDRGTYLLTQEYQVDEGLPQPQDVQTAWTYTSAGTSQPGQTPPGSFCLLQAFTGNPALPCRAEPLVLLRYRLLDLGLDNRMRAPGAGKLLLTAYHQPSASAASIRGARVWMTVDGGAHWRPAEADPLGGGRFLAELTFPRLAGASGLVGLRVEAWDADGNRTVQTVSNAFGLVAR